MSGDEVFVTVVSVLLGPVAWLLWLYVASGLQRRRQPGTLNVVAGAVAASTLLIFIVLKTAASFDVVDDTRYQVMYLLLGLAWVRVAQFSFTLAGVSARDDVAERGNRAAAAAVGGALVGTALCYAGGNIGDGPGWWVVVFCAAIATAMLLISWIALTSITALGDAVIIGRDRAAGLRLAGFLVAVGLVLGRAVAGDWHSGAETISDFVAVLPWAAMILLTAIGVEWTMRPTPERPHGSMVGSGLLPAVVYLGLAVTTLNRLGWPT
jgi:uncharacterized membrane protein YjfL (UPF0719 family)